MDKSREISGDRVREKISCYSEVVAPLSATTYCASRGLLVVWVYSCS
jgi:hypothetical protein